MNRKQKTTNFFRDMYEPVLLRAESKDALQRRAAKYAAARMRISPIDEARRTEAARKGMQKFWASLPPEEKRFRIMCINASRLRALTPEKKRELASNAGKHSWDNRNPEDRKTCTLKATEARMLKYRKWPFPKPRS